MNIISIISILIAIAAVVLIASSCCTSEPKVSKTPIYRVVKEKRLAHGYLYKVEKFDDDANIWTHVNYFYTEEEAFEAVGQLEGHGIM